MGKEQRVRWIAYIQDIKINRTTETSLTEEEENWDDQGKDCKINGDKTVTWLIIIVTEKNYVEYSVF